VKLENREKSIMNIGGPTASPPSMPAAQTARVDKDGDNDNDKTESAAAKAKEAQKQPAALPADTNRGRTLNTTA